jgi:hypothetical protein
MTKYLLFLMMMPIGFYAQSLSVHIGSTESQLYYNSFDDENASWDLSSESAFSASIFYHSPFRNSDYFLLKTGLTYQGMNSRGFLVNVPLRYQTKYLSLSSSLELIPYTYYLNKYCSSCSKIRFVSSIGLEAAKIVSGTQTVGNAYAYDLMMEEEFNGLLYGPSLSFAIDLDLFGYTSLLLNYTYTYFINSNRNPERVDIGRGIISFGIKQEL